MGQNYMLNSAIDCMLGTTFIVCLLFITQYFWLFLDVSGKGNLLLNILFNKTIAGTVGQNDNTNLFKGDVQSAENLSEFSETIRQLPQNSLPNHEIEQDFYKWLAGVLDVDGNFDIRKNRTGGYVLKKIRIKLHNRDLRLLTYIQNKLHIGRIRDVKNKPHSLLSFSKKNEIIFLIKKINGNIRLKLDSFKQACSLYDIKFVEPNSNIEKNDPYFAGLIDTDGSIVFNFENNRIECTLEVKYSEYSSKLCLDNVIPYAKPSVIYREKTNQTKNKKFQSISFKFQNVSHIVPVYDYFIKNRLMCDFKFYRVSQIKRFMEIRHYNKYPFESHEYKLYSQFVLNWIMHINPNWTKVPFVQKLNLKKFKV